MAGLAARRVAGAAAPAAADDDLEALLREIEGLSVAEAEAAYPGGAVRQRSRMSAPEPGPDARRIASLTPEQRRLLELRRAPEGGGRRQPARGRCRGGRRERAAALLRPAAALVPRPLEPGLGGLQHPVRASACRARSTCAALRPRLHRDGAPARGAAHHLRRGRGRPVQVDRAARGPSPLPVVDLRGLPAARRERGGRCAWAPPRRRGRSTSPAGRLLRHAPAAADATPT